MENQLTRESFQDITYPEEGFKKLLKYFENDFSANDFHLCLLIGDVEAAKKKALKSIAGKTDREIYSVDANDIVTQNESESRQNIEDLLEDFDPEEQLLHLQNGSRLSGVYIAHSLSRVKYATPQEKYFIKKATETGGLFVVDIDEPEEAGRTIRRAAQSIVNFPVPKSGFKKILWGLKHFTLQGSHLKNDRPREVIYPS
jgi:hypothetical protein